MDRERRDLQGRVRHDLGISYDRFIRTTDADHYAASQAIWKKMEANGDIYLSKYEGWYSVRDEAFYVEDETVIKDDGIRYTREDRHRGPRGPRRRATSSGCPPTRTNCSRSTRPTPNSVPRSPASTRSSAWSSAAWRTCRSAAPRSTGASRPGQRQARHVRVGRRPDELPHRVGYPDVDSRILPEIPAGRRARHRQGHLPLPRHLLAGVPDERRPSCPSGS